jgi:DeoR/GlpR family transcriptional regulator of sugar metabolism
VLAAERRSAILERIDDDGAARVTELARRFQVTEETIRRDLEKLDQEGRVRRTHGGAVPLEAIRHDHNFDNRRNVNLMAKQKLARAAVHHIHEGDVIALDASSTVAAMLPLLPDVPLTIVTHSLIVVNSLLNRPHIRVVCTGGILDAPSMSFTGSRAESTLERFRIGKLFFSCKGIDLERGLSVPEDDQARIKRRMVELAECSYLLVDRSKIGVRSTFFFAEPGQVDHLVTDAGAEELAGIESELETV